MTKEREALKLALEALGKAKRQIVHANVAPHGCIVDAITAIKEALAQPAPAGMLHIDRLDKWLDASLKKRKTQPEQEPVAYCYVQKGTSVDILTFDDEPNDAVDGTIFPLYTASPKREWVGLTDEEASWCQAPSTIQTWKRIEAKLKEKNT